MNTLFFIGQIGSLLCLVSGGVICITEGVKTNRESQKEEA